MASPAGPGETRKTVPVDFILVDTLSKAQDVLRRLKLNEDFVALAHEVSIDPSAKDGGFLGDVDPTTLRPELGAALAGLQPGQITGVVRTPTGFAILKILKQAKSGDEEESDRTRLLELAAPMSVRLTRDNSGYAEFYQAMLARFSTAPPLDLKQVCAIRQQAPLDALTKLKEFVNTSEVQRDPYKVVNARYSLARLLLALGDTDRSIEELETVYRLALPKDEALAQYMEQTMGVSYLHRALLVDHSSPGPINANSIFPSHPGPSQAKAADTAKAILYLSKCMKRDPANTELQWLLNLAYMAAGDYPSHVPKEFLIPPSVFASKEDVGHFSDVAPAAGVATYGTAGGVIIDDFDNDGLLDIVTSQVDDCEPLRFFHNNGNGTFTDRAKQAGLSDQLGGLNIIQADYNNDGCMDVLVLRGGWEFARRRSLLRNNCDGTFTDVTAQSGLLEPATASQSAVWVDIDNDGKLDLFIANENAPSQLFLNKGDGTFVDISREAGIDRTAISKGVVAADYDNDGYPDLYVSNFNGTNVLYHNNGDRTFTDVSLKAGVKLPWMSFSAAFFDYDNDGWPDLFVTSYFFSLEEVARSYMGLPRKGETVKLYRNMHDGTFRDVTAEVGLDRVFMVMGMNFGDIDNDGFLDLYLGTGNPSFSSVMPNVLMHNQGGKHFVDVTASSGTGAIAKGHGAAFADLNNSGDEHIFAVMGGPTPGDRFTTRLFENPGGHGNDWISLRLVGVKSNRAAIGARIAVTVENEGSGQRTIWRTVGSGGSFGASPLEQHIGLGKSARIEKIEIDWPASKTRQNIEHVEPNEFLEIKEFEKNATKLKRSSFPLGGKAREASAQPGL